MRWEGERLIAAVKSAEHVEQPSLDSDLASALRIVLASYSATTARRLAPIAETMLDGCSITIAPDATWEKPAKSAKAQTASRSITLTKTGPTATPPTSRPSAHPAIPVTICEQDLWAVHQRAERRLRLFASRQVEAFGDAVIPQIPEAIGKAILLEGGAMEVVIAAATAILGVFCLTGAIEGYMLKYWSTVTRIMLAVGALMLMIPGTVTDLIGIGLAVLGFVLDKLIFKPQPKEPAKA